MLLGNVPLGYELWRQFHGFPADASPAAKDASKPAGGKNDAGKGK